MKRSTRIALTIILPLVGYTGYMLFTGPRMYVTPHIRAYQAAMPQTPPGAVPVHSPLPGPLPTTQQSLDITTRPATHEDLTNGKAYYEYYACLACHGPEGDGRGPVGESYVPPPADLRLPKYQAYSDGLLLRAMLTGPGHEPVLERTVLAAHRWPLVHYVRTLGQAQTQPAPN